MRCAAKYGAPFPGVMKKVYYLIIFKTKLFLFFELLSTYAMWLKPSYFVLKFFKRIIFVVFHAVLPQRLASRHNLQPLLRCRCPSPPFATARAAMMLSDAATNISV
jgi:hypothetical protein